MDTEGIKMADIFSTTVDVDYVKETSELWRVDRQPDDNRRQCILHDLNFRCAVGARISTKGMDPFFNTARLYDSVYPRTKICFPLCIKEFRGIPINAHPGAFGCSRKYNFHEGVDLYCGVGSEVYAIYDCEVVSVGPFTGASVGMPWWLETDAVTVKYVDCNDCVEYFVYGEIDPQEDIKVGTKLSCGDLIGEVIPVLPNSKKRSDIPMHEVSMLHFERYNGNYDPSYGWAGWEKREDRPVYLEDPTDVLFEALGKYCGKKTISK